MLGVTTMQLNDLLNAMDAAAANIGKMEAIWDRVQPMIPTGMVIDSNPPEYHDLERRWKDLKEALPSVHGWTVTCELPNPEEIGMALIDLDPLQQISVLRVIDQVIWELGEYTYRLNKARKEAIRGRLTELIGVLDTNLPGVLVNVPRHSTEVLSGPKVEKMKDAMREVERLVGDTVQRTDRWNHLHRHMSFSQGQDWHDIAEVDWPTVKQNLMLATVDELDPVPTPPVDLGTAAAAKPSGPAATALAWEALDPEGFERLLFNLLDALPSFQNVQWLVHTNAPDRGRDISAERVVDDGAGGVRTERVIVQAKHWRSKPVNAPAVSDTLTQVELWQPPPVHNLIIATSGKFSTDGVDWYEKHNQKGTFPVIEAWPDSQLERLLARNPGVAAAAGLR